MGYIHGLQAINSVHHYRFILQDAIAEHFQFHADGVGLLDFRVIDGDGFFTAVGFNIQGK